MWWPWYDTTWRYGILRDLHDLGIRGRLVTVFESFLADRWIQVRVGSTLSEQFDQAQGVPQGSILSTTLFNIKINSIMDCLDPRTDGSLYVVNHLNAPLTWEQRLAWDLLNFRIKEVQT